MLAEMSVNVEHCNTANSKQKCCCIRRVSLSMDLVRHICGIHLITCLDYHCIVGLVCVVVWCHC